MVLHFHVPTSEVTCQDEESNRYFEGTSWSVGDCMKCSCNNGNIKCTRKVSIPSFNEILTEHCNQTDCRVASFIKETKSACKG